MKKGGTASGSTTWERTQTRARPCAVYCVECHVVSPSRLLAKLLSAHGHTLPAHVAKLGDGKSEPANPPPGSCTVYLAHANIGLHTFSSTETPIRVTGYDLGRFGLVVRFLPF